MMIQPLAAEADKHLFAAAAAWLSYATRVSDSACTQVSWELASSGHMGAGSIRPMDLLVPWQDEQVHACGGTASLCIWSP